MSKLVGGTDMKKKKELQNSSFINKTEEGQSKVKEEIIFNGPSEENFSNKNSNNIASENSDKDSTSENALSPKMRENTHQSEKTRTIHSPSELTTRFPDEATRVAMQARIEARNRIEKQKREEEERVLSHSGFQEFEENSNHCYDFSSKKISDDNLNTNINDDSLLGKRALSSTIDDSATIDNAGKVFEKDFTENSKENEKTKNIQISTQKNNDARKGNQKKKIKIICELVNITFFITTFNSNVE